MPTSVVEKPELVETLVRRAHIRHIAVALFDELGLAAAFLFGGLALLLVFGTDVLSWYLLPLLTLAGLGIVAFRVKTRIKSRYRVAQMLDARLRLDDSISTAWFLLSEPNAKADEGARAYLFERSEHLARGANPREALPFEGGRMWAVAGSVAAVALTLFFLRYAVTKRLDLHPALLPLSIPSVIAEVEDALHIPRQNSPGGEKGSGLPNTSGNERDSAEGESKDHPFKPYDVTPAEAGSHRTSEPDSFTAGRENTGAQGGQSEELASGAIPAGAKHPKAGSPEQQGSDSNNEKNRGAKSADSKPGLMERMEGALSSLMAELKPAGRSGQQQNQQGDQDRQSAGQMGSNNTDANGNPQQGKPDTQPTAQETPASSAEAAASNRIQTAKSKGSSTSSSNKNSDSQSGIGHENGAKQLQDAEELKAMGKLAEIIGKRSAETTGDATIETSSGNQQLKTQYSGRIGQHADRGGEIDRDQIPLEYRDYVRQYMERIRKQADKAN